MQISKSRFLNLVRCDRYAALDKIYREKFDALVTTDPDSMEAIYSEETNYKKLEALQSMYAARREDRDFDINILDDEEEYVDLIKDDLESPFQDDFAKIELLAARALHNRFGGTITAGIEIKDQKHYKASYEGYKFHCFLDVYLENDDEIIICEVKASTSKTMLEKGGKNPLFKNYDGIFFRNHEKEKGMKKVNQIQFFDPFHDLGKMTVDLAFQRFVIEQSDEKISKPTKYYLALLNHEYYYDGKIDSDGEPIYPDEIIRLFDLTKLTEELQPKIKSYVDTVVNRINDSNINPVKLGKHCQLKKVRQCPYYEACRIAKDIPEENSIFNFINNHYGFSMPEDSEKHDRFDLIEQGFTKITDFNEENLNYPQQKIQLDVITKKEPYFDNQNIKAGLEMLRYPLYHLDFETFAAPLPRFAGEKCYLQSAFQYSLHIERAPGVCDEDKDHIEFLVKNHRLDQREELFDSLVSHLDNPNGMILAYNVSFEKMVIRNYIEHFPKHEAVLRPFLETAFDLQDLIKGRTSVFPQEVAPNKILFYDERLNGSYSIKKVLPIFAPELTYQDLEVQKGTDAVLEFSKLSNMNPDEYEKTYQALLEYCKRDTWAMVVILDNLRKAVK